MRYCEIFIGSLLLNVFTLLSAVRFTDASPAFLDNLNTTQHDHREIFTPEATTYISRERDDDKPSSSCITDRDVKRELAGDASFVSFQDFIQGVKSVSFEGFSLKAVQNKDAFEEMRSHILHMYGGVTVKDVTSFFLEGNYVDCIAIKEQPTVFHFGIIHIEKPPIHAASPDNGTTTAAANGTKHAFAQGADSLLKLGLTDQFKNTISCPQDAIPMSRLTLEQLTRSKTLRDSFGKLPNKSKSLRPRGAFVPRDLEPGRKYAFATQVVTNYGGQSFLQIWNPVADFSLSQQLYTGGSPEQIVEGGWIVYPDHFNTPNTLLFIYWTSDDYATTGCYNLECPGFVQVNSNWNLGVIFDHISTPGSHWRFTMQWKLVNEGWWLYLQGSGATIDTVGYYPASIFNGGQLSISAQRMDFRGEVGRKPGDNWSPMGSGVLSTAGGQASASQTSIFYSPLNENGGAGVWCSLVSSSPDAPCYTADSDYDLGTYMLYGGPGGDIVTCGA